MSSDQDDQAKKISEEEKRQSREIVLEAIGEKKATAADLEAESKVEKKATDTFFGFKFGKEKEEREEVKIAKTVKPEEGRQEIDKIINIASQAEKEILPQEKSPDFIKDALQTVAKAPVKKIVPAISKKPVEAIKKSKVQKTIEKKPFFKLAKPHRQKIPHAKLGVYERRTSNVKSKLAGWLSFRGGTQENLKHFEQRINDAVRQSLKLVLVFIVILIVVYSAFVAAIIKWNLDSASLRKIASYVIIPALITKDGIIQYYDYVDLKKNLPASETSAKTAIIKGVILNSLYRKLKISPNKSLEEINQLVIADEDINKAPLASIRKINGMLKRGDDFISVGAKYSDELGGVEINSSNYSKYNFSEEVKKMQPGEISDIINGTNGNYIFKCMGKSDESSNLSYIFIKSINLNDYLNDEVINYQAISFVD